MDDSIAIFGADGYIGWPLAMHLGSRNPDKNIILVDNLVTRRLVRSVGSRSLVPIRSMEDRIASYEKATGLHNLKFIFADARDPESVEAIFREHLPTSVVHLAQQRSAPFSMIDQEHALYTQLNNISTNMNILHSISRYTPSSHLLKMGSMGEYGTPEIEITEGDLEVERKGRTARVMFPPAGQSWYHLSKVFDTFNVKLANKLFGITATDVMQGVVYGVRVNEMVSDALATRFDFDSNWGTVINKYVVQAIALNKLLIYGRGKQKRGFLSLYDSINCLTLLLENPPSKGEYRIVNQLDEIYDTLELATRVQSVAKEFGIKADLEWLENPRVEKEEHYYEVEHKILPSLGFKREKKMEETLFEIFESVLKNKNRIDGMRNLIYPTVSWKSAAKTKCVSNFKLPRGVTTVASANLDSQSVLEEEKAIYDLDPPVGVAKDDREEEIPIKIVNKREYDP